MYTRHIRQHFPLHLANKSLNLPSIPNVPTRRRQKQVVDSMDAIIGARLCEMQNFLAEDDVYQACGVDAMKHADDIACSIRRDIHAMQHASKAWDGPSHYMAKYNDLAVIIAALHRKIRIHDIDGSMWCINEACKYLPMFSNVF